MCAGETEVKNYRNWVQTALNEQPHGPWCPSRETSRSVNLSTNLRELLEVARKSFTEGFTVLCLPDERTQPNIPPLLHLNRKAIMLPNLVIRRSKLMSPDDHPPRVTRSRAARAILQDTSPLSEEGGSSSGSREESRSKSDAASGSQSDNNSRGSAESAGESQNNATTSPLVVHTKADNGARDEAGNVEEDVEITFDDTMVQSENFFNHGIVTKSGGFKKRAIMCETRVVVADIKAFPDIYRTFQFHQFDWMINAIGEYSSHLDREFYSSYATTLMNFVAETETTKRDQKDVATTWGPLNSIMVWGTSIDISEATINRMLHSPEYTAPASVGLF
uniref:Uncharacterized protein n=1 Tax=Solanum tuberosum TaxID=4113 RepID=M1DHD6_SOLTU